MNGYNTTAIGADRATLRSDPSALMVAYSIGRYALVRTHLDDYCHLQKTETKCF